VTDLASSYNYDFHLNGSSTVIQYSEGFFKNIQCFFAVRQIGKMGEILLDYQGYE
jgi:hypothetical protein